MGSPPKQQKNSIRQPKVQTSTVTINTQKTFVSQQQSAKTISSEKKIGTSKASLVFYEIAKAENSIIEQSDKVLIMVSSLGIIFAMGCATLINMAQLVIKPLPHKKKWFMIFAGANFLTSTVLLGYTYSNLIDLYDKVPYEKWKVIQQQKNAYDKLSFSEQKALMMEQVRLSDQKMKNAFIQNEKKKRQQNIQLSK